MARSAKVTLGGSGGGSRAPGGKGRKRRRLRRFLIVSCLLIVVLVGGLLAAAPMIAGAVAPGVIEDALNPKLKGSIDVTDVRVRWMRAGSPVQTASVAVYDDRQNKIADVTIQSQVGILSVLGGIGDLGEFVVTGHADVVRHADGTTNIERVFAPLLGGGAQPPAKPAPGGSPPSLPPHLRAVLRIASLTGTYTDESMPAPLRVTLEKLTGRAVFATGQPAELTLDVAILTGAGAAQQRGTLAVQGSVDKLSSAAGALTISRATANITATARDLPIVVADSLGGLGGTLTRAVGERLGFDISVVGTMQQGTGRVALATDGGTSLRGALRFADNVLTTSEPLTFTLDTARAAAANPAIAAALSEGEAARITTLPTLSLTLGNLRIALPAGGAALDLRGAQANVTASLGEMAGTVLVPGQTVARTFRLTPMDVVLKTDDLARGISLATAGEARIDNQAAGVLRIDVTARDLLDATGGVRGGVPTIAGAVVVEEFTIAIVQPILDAIAPDSGLTLTEALGPTLGLRLTAESDSGGGAPPAPGAIPPTTIGLSIDSANVTAGGNLRVASDAVRTLDDQGLWLKIASLAPIAGAMLEPAGVTLESGGQVTFRVQDVNLADPMAQTPPLERARARVSFTISETRGQLKMGAAPTNYRLDPGTLSLTVDGATDAIALVGRLDALITGNGRITAQMDTTLSGMLGQLTGKPQAATSSGEGVRITTQQVGRWLAAVLPEGAPVQVDSGGEIVVALSGLAIAAPPARPAGSSAGKAPAVPEIAQRLTMNVDVTGSGVRFAPVLQAALPGEAAPRPEMIEMTGLTLAARLAPATPPSLTLDSNYTTSGQQFTIGGNLGLAGPLGQATSMREMVPRGRMALSQVPVELLRLVPISIPGSNGEPVNLTAILGEAVGRKVDLVLGLVAPRRDEPAANTTVALRITGRGLRLETGGVLNAEGFAAGESVLTASLTPRLVQMLVNNFAADLPHPPSLTEDASIRATVAPFTLALDENLAPRPGATVSLRAGLETALTVDNLVMASDGNQRPINAGPVRLEGVRATATLPMVLGAAPVPAGTATPPPAGPMALEFAATARRPGRAESSLVALSGTASMNAGVLDARATAAGLDLDWLDASMGKPGMLSGALGPTLRADVTFAGDPAKTAQATLTLAAANLSMAQPARVSLTESAITLAAPLNAVFTATPEWATRYMFGQSDPGNVMARAQNAIPFTVNVANLNITRGPGRGPLVPGEWGVDATITAPEISVLMREGQNLRYISPEVIVRTARNDPRKINASVRMTEARQIAAAGTPAAPAAGQPGPATPTNPAQNILRLSITNLMDDAGQIALSGATAEAIGRIPGFPTELVDALARQNGLLVELLGPAVTIDVTARNVPLAFAAPPPPPTTGLSGAAAAATGAAPRPAPPPGLRGRVEADLRSDRASARLAGDINNMVLTTSEPLAISLSEITRAFSQKIAAGMPLVSTFEKPRSLNPATVQGEAITLPMDGNMANLNGRFAVDLGEIQFSSSNLLGSLLKAAGGQASGVAGRRLQPFNFTITSGVVNYDKFTLPLGEFSISTTGKVNLVDNSMDLIVYLPVGAVADDALGMFNIGLGTSLSQIAPGFTGSLPFRIRGPMGTAKPEPALDIFVKDFGSQLVNPGNLLQRFLPGSGGQSGEGGGRGGLPFFRRGGG